MVTEAQFAALKKFDVVYGVEPEVGPVVGYIAGTKPMSTEEGPAHEVIVLNGACAVVNLTAGEMTMLGQNLSGQYKMLFDSLR